MSDLPWPFRPDTDPYHFVEIAPNEWIRVVLAGDYNQLLEQHLKLQAEARAIMEQANEVIAAWRAYERTVAD
jgi:hypothetical protein